MFQNYIHHARLLMRNTHPSTRVLCRRFISNGEPLPSDAYKALDAKGKTLEERSHDTPRLSHAQREYLGRAIRVDQAGEIAANYIYMGQIAVLGGNPTLRPVLQVCFP